MHGAASTLRILQDEAIEEFDLVRGTNATVKVFKIGAAAKGDVLTIVDVLSVWQFIGGRSAAEIGPQLKEFYLPAGLSQRDAGRQTRQPAADHDHVFRGHFPLYDAQSVPGR